LLSIVAHTYSLSCSGDETGDSLEPRSTRLAGYYNEMLSYLKKKAGHWWLTPIILATQEAEIWRIFGV
jgi:hypothetical protein